MADPIRNDAEDPAREAGEPLAEVAYTRIKQAIIGGALRPGLLGSEQQIAVKLSMSRTPVHQAIVKLSQEGWVELVPKRGIRISSLSSAEMRDVYEALMALEIAGVKRLAESDDLTRQRAVNALEQVCAAGDAALRKGDLLAWAVADDDFHRLLVDLCGNAHLSRLAKSIMEQAQRARLLTLKLRPTPTASNADHRAIVEAIAQRDATGAGERLRIHREHGMATLLPILDALQPIASTF